MKMKMLVMLLVTSAAVQLSAYAKGGANTNAPQSPDQKFVTQVGQAQMFDIQLSQLAANTSSNADVVALAQQVENDQTTANNNLSTIASNNGFDMPSDLDVAHQRALDKFSSLSGTKFDKAFAKQIAVSETRQSKMYGAEAARTDNADLQTYASDTTALDNDGTAAKQLSKEIK